MYKNVAVIPARGGSKRLPHKNIYPFYGKPLIAWSIEACRRSAFIEKIFVSSDDAEILKIAQNEGCEIIERPNELADDKTPKMEAIRHAEAWIADTFGCCPEIIASIQANSPEMKTSDIDLAFTLLERHRLWEVFSVDEDGVQNGAIRLIRRDCLYNSFLSAHCGVIRTDYVDVHRLDDLNTIMKKYSNENEFLNSRG